LRRGAKLVESAADVLQILAIGAPVQGELPVTAVAVDAASLLPEERKLWQALADDCPIDVLTGRTGLASGQVSALLLQMELKGLVVQRPGMVYRRSEGIRVPAAEEG
jgi:DNA processing protein